MKTKFIQLGAIATLALAGSIIAADPAPAPAAPPSSSSATSPAAASTQFQGKITAVDKETKMVTIQDASGATKKLHIGDTTKLSKGSTAADTTATASATWEDLKVGQEIRGTQKMQGTMSHAETVTIGTSTEAK